MAIIVSCIIPCFNDAKNLPNAVASCLSQSDEVEIIIIDDCSTDTSFQVAQEIVATSAGKVRAFRNAQNSGPAFTRNHGVLYALGAFLCFLDSDDQYLPGFVKSCSSMLASKPELAAVKALMEVVNPDGSRPLDMNDPRLIAASASYPCNMVVRKEVFLALGGFPIDARYRGPLAGEDDAFFRILTKLFRCQHIPQTLVRHNNRSGSHLEKFLNRTRVENRKIIFTHHDPSLKEQEVIAANKDYFLRARRNLSTLNRCSLLKMPEHAGRAPVRQSSKIAQKDAAGLAREGVPHISFVTTCKGRLHHLQQTLPLLAKLPDVEIIVVDYACPQGTATWVEEHYPHVRIVRITDDPGFHVGRARNAGANAATSPWLCFIDADVAIKDGLVPWAIEHLRLDAFYRPQPSNAEAYGSFFCPRAAFLETGGYDEAIRGWGGEDDDFYLRLKRAGYRADGYPLAQVSPIHHGDEERTTFYKVKNKNIFQRAYQWYAIMKYDMMDVRAGSLPLSERMSLMKLAWDAVAREDQTSELEHIELSLTLGERMDVMRFNAWEIQRKIIYRHVPRDPASQPSRENLPLKKIIKVSKQDIQS